MSTDPIELVLQIELESIESEIAAVREKMAQLEREQAEAVDAEGEAMRVATEAHAYADPLVWETGREHVSQQDEAKVIQVGIVVGDTLWRMNYPEAAQALGQAQAADQARQRASAHTIECAHEREHLEYHVLPVLNAALANKRKELDAHRQAQEQARVHVESRGAWLDEFRKKIRGDA